MSRAPSTFRKRDVTAAVEAAKAAGIEVARIEVDKDGKIVVVAGKPVCDNSESVNPWDGVLKHEQH